MMNLERRSDFHLRQLSLIYNKLEIMISLLSEFTKRLMLQNNKHKHTLATILFVVDTVNGGSPRNWRYIDTLKYLGIITNLDPDKNVIR